MKSPNAQDTLEPDPEEKPRPHPPDSLRRILEKLFHGDFHIPRRPARRVLLVLLAVSAAVLLWRAGQRSFRTVEPGFLGVCVNRFTGSLASLSPGTHFRPPAIYQIHPVRVSDQLLSGTPVNFRSPRKRA